MPEFVSKPVQIEARRWEGGPAAATPIINWILEHDGTARYHEKEHAYTSPNTGKLVPEVPETIRIDTLEGTMRAKPGDWIIRGTENEFYPCVDSVFRRKYEEAQS